MSIIAQNERIIRQRICYEMSKVDKEYKVVFGSTFVGVMFPEREVGDVISMEYGIKRGKVLYCRTTRVDGGVRVVKENMVRLNESVSVVELIYLYLLLHK